MVVDIGHVMGTYVDASLYSALSHFTFNNNSPTRLLTLSDRLVFRMHDNDVSTPTILIMTGITISLYNRHDDRSLPPSGRSRLPRSPERVSLPPRRTTVHVSCGR
jgi:hypothetical protein